mgnify:CR=1 FL=1
MEAFPNNPNVDGWGARKCKLQFASPRIPWSQHNLFQFWDAQQGCTTVWTPSTWCRNRKHVMGWDENVNPLSGQSKCLENQLLILFQHFAGYYTTLYYVDGQQVESIGTSPWCIIYDGHGPSALKTQLKLTLIYYSGVVFFHWRSAGIPRIIYPQRPGATAASATQQSHKDLGVFSWRRHDCGA